MTGRITFFVLSFVDGNERVALPFHALSLDTRGRARLVSKESRPDGAFPLGEIPSAPRYSPALDASALEGEPAVLGSRSERRGRATFKEPSPGA